MAKDPASTGPVHTKVPSFILRHAKSLARTFLHSADLAGVDLAGISFEEATLAKANLMGANLLEACLYGADLRGANLQNARLNDADLRHARLDGALLDGVLLVEAGLENASLVGASLVGANLTDACCWNANFSNADLSGANLTSADLQDAILAGAKFEENTIPPREGCTNTNLRLEGARLTKISDDNRRTITIATPPEIYDRLQEWALEEGRTSDNLAAYLIETCVQSRDFHTLGNLPRSSARIRTR